MTDLKLTKVISPNKDKGNGFKKISLKKPTAIPKEVRAQKTVQNVKKDGWKY